jgi:PPOX class probable FMN-dependent enzyme
MLGDEQRKVEAAVARITSLDELREIIPPPSEKAFVKIRPMVCEQGRDFIDRCPFVMLATAGAWGLEVSQKGGEAGFLRLEDERTLLIPEYRGNQFALALGNILADPRVGLALIRPGTDEVLRISGRATLERDQALCETFAAGGKPAVLVIRVAIDRAAFHCPRSARRAGLWEPQRWEPAQQVSFGQIYAEALKTPEVRDLFDKLSKENEATLY